MMKAVVLALAVLTAGCGSDSDDDVDSDGGGGADSGTSTGGAHLRATINGEVINFDVNSRADIAGLGVSVIGQTAAPSRSMIFNFNGSAPGTKPCVAASGPGTGQQMVHGSSNGTAQAVPNGTCSVVLTQYANAVGEFFVGTFTGQLFANGGFIANVTNGSFRLPRTM